MNQLYIDLHAIHTLPPSNVNRDDVGSPKTSIYGGVERSRVSSQSWKRAIRGYFNEHFESDKLSYRTVEVLRMVTEKIREIDATIDEKNADKKAREVLKLGGINFSGKKTTTDALFFIGEEQVRQLAQKAVEGEPSTKTALEDYKKQIKDILEDISNSVEIALFGRMFAGNQDLKVEASSQVAHAISTHGVEVEYDYFTAIDDFTKDDKDGATMIGTQEFTSSTLYRYANINVRELQDHLQNKDLTVDTIKTFVGAFYNSLPTGKVNTFANTTLPETLVVVIREDRPINLVTAYENPVKHNQGHIQESVERLGNELRKASRVSKEPVDVFYIDLSESGLDFGDSVDTWDDLEGRLVGNLEQHVE